MFNITKFTTRLIQNTKTKRETRAFKFNGQRIFISGFTTDETIPTEIMGTAYKIVDLPVVNNNEMPIYNQTSLRPIALDLKYDLQSDSISIMESSNTEIIIASYSDGISPSVLSSVKSTAILIECGDTTVPIERESFNTVESSVLMVNSSDNSLFPFEVFIRTGRAENVYPEKINEWPNYKNIYDITEKISLGCSIGRIIHNDSNVILPKINRKQYFSIGIKLKDNILNILKSKFTITESKFFRIIFMPIFCTLSDISGDVKILYPTEYEDIDRLDFILFSNTTSESNSNISYMIKIKSNNTELVSGTSFGTFNSNGIWTEQYSPFRFLFTKNGKISEISNTIPLYNGENKSIGADNDAENILIEVNDILSKKLEEYTNIRIEIYANNGFKDTGI